jgi:anti-anti-sigma factor
MEIVERSLGDVGFLALSGNLIEGSAYSQGAIFRRIDRLAASGKRLLVLDLTNLASVDAMGLGEIAEAYRRARAGGADLKLLRPQPRVDRLLSITKLRTVIDVCDREEDIHRSSAAGCRVLGEPSNGTGHDHTMCALASTS